MAARCSAIVPVHDAVERRDVLRERAVLPRRHARRNVEEHARALVDVLEQIGDGAADVVGLAAHVGAEERVADDPERERHHVFVDVDLGAGATFPVTREVERGLPHRALGLANTVAMKRWLEDAALAEPEFAFAREEAVAEDEADLVEPARLLAVGLVVVLQDVAHARRIGEEGRADPTKVHRRGVAVLFARAQHEPQRIAAQRAVVLEDQSFFSSFFFFLRAIRNAMPTAGSRGR